MIRSQDRDHLTAYGDVESVESGWAYVRTQRVSACGGCQSSETCGTSSLSRLFSQTLPSLVKLPNVLDAQPGDKVVLSLAASKLTSQALIAYALPLMGFFGFALMAQFFFGHELWVALSALLGLVLVLFLIKKYHRPVQPVMIERISSQNTT